MISRPQSEFYEFYQFLENSSGWPLTGPDEPEGANLANPMIHGLGDVMVADRLDVPLWIDDAPSFYEHDI
jgi:hypothetical protein